jgi:hypothetical protein
MSIILSKATYTGQTMQFAALLIPVNSPELCIPDRKILIGTRLGFIDFTVVRTVHGF